LRTLKKCRLAEVAVLKVLLGHANRIFITYRRCIMLIVLHCTQVVSIQRSIHQRPYPQLADEQRDLGTVRYELRLIHRLSRALRYSDQPAATASYHPSRNHPAICIFAAFLSFSLPLPFLAAPPLPINAHVRIVAWPGSSRCLMSVQRPCSWNRKPQAYWPLV